MDIIENTIDKTIYVVSELIFDFARIVTYLFNGFFAFLGDKDCKAKAEGLFEKIKADFLK